MVTASQETSTCGAGVPVSVTTTPITITSGAVAQLLVYPYQNVEDNADGTISQSMNALVKDAHGNPVENGTAVTFTNDYPAVAPLEILVTITPDSAPGNFGGAGGITVVAEYIDGAAFPNPIAGVNLDFTSSSAFASVVSTPVMKNLDGFAYTTVTTTACLPTNTQVTIIASDPPVSGFDTMTILATDPTVSFTVSGTSPTFNFTNTSTEPPGYNYSYLWNFGDTNTSTSENPSHTYAASGTYTVTLTVTNTGAPGACSDITTGSVTVP